MISTVSCHLVSSWEAKLLRLSQWRHRAIPNTLAWVQLLCRTAAELPHPKISMALLIFSHFLNSLVSIAFLLYPARLLLPHSFQQQQCCQPSTAHMSRNHPGKTGSPWASRSPLTGTHFFCHWFIFGIYLDSLSKTENKNPCTITMKISSAVNCKIIKLIHYIVMPLYFCHLKPVLGMWSGRNKGKKNLLGYIWLNK